MIVVVAVKSNFELLYRVALRSRNIREETLVVSALVELVNGIYGAHDGNVTKYDFCGSHAYDRAIRLKELLNGLTLTEAKDVDVEPEIGDSGIPWTGDCTERRQKEIIDGPDKNVNGCDGEETKK